MSTKSQCSLTFAETNDDSFHPANDVWELDVRPPDLSRTGVEAQSSTHRVWHDYLSQLGVHAAIMNLSLPPAGSQRHAYLVGFESARYDAPATEQLLALAERIWSRLGSDPILQFDLSNVAHDDTETNLIAHMLHRLGHGVAAQAHHNGVTVRAIYFRKKGLHPPRQHDVGSLKLILPLFAESAAGGVQLALQSQRSAMLEAMFDRVSLSMTVLTADAKPLFMNSAAKAMLEERKWLIRKADGSVSSTNSKNCVKASAPQRPPMQESCPNMYTAWTPVPVNFAWPMCCRHGQDLAIRPCAAPCCLCWRPARWTHLPNYWKRLDYYHLNNASLDISLNPAAWATLPRTVGCRKKRLERI